MTKKEVGPIEGLPRGQWFSGTLCLRRGFPDLSGVRSGRKYTDPDDQHHGVLNRIG